MAVVHFYEKSGCVNNARQKRLLEHSGHTVIAHDLLATSWTAGELRAYFGALPVREWFNAAAPRIKSGEIATGSLDAGTALDLMLADPLLIRRPLMRSEGRRQAGFDPAVVHAWLGLAGHAPGDEGAAWEQCPHE